MCRKGRVLQLVVTLSTLLILVTVAITLLVDFNVIEVEAGTTESMGEIRATTPLLQEQRDVMGMAEAKNEVRSVPSPSYGQSRPVYAKPKPKLVLPKQLQQAKVTEASPSSPQKGFNPNLVTQTVYGFLNFVTTVGNTVMIFTPQTKQADLNVTPASSASTVRPTMMLQPIVEAVESVTLEAAPESNQRSARLLDIDLDDDEHVVSEQLESSEYEPQVVEAPVTSTPSATMSDLEHITIIGDTASASSKQVVTVPAPEVRTQVNVVTAVDQSQPSKGFILKFPRPSTTKGTEDHQTGLVSRNVESKVINGLTTVHETKVLGTYIGTQYARIVESSSTILPLVVTASGTVASSVTTTSKPVQGKTVESVEIVTAKSVTSSGDLENSRFQDELLENVEEPEEILGPEDFPTTPDPTPTSLPAPTSKATQFVLPEKDVPAQVYAAPGPSPNAYSRQPQIYVDVSPATSFDYVVTATPSRKPFRPQTSTSRSTEPSRFTNRNPPPTSTSTSTESNELVLSYDTPDNTGGGRGSSRFRNTRNRNNYKNKSVVEAEAVISTVAPQPQPSPGRKFTLGRGPSSGKEFKLGSRATSQSSRPSFVTPTTSTSVYRFKLNRPTGRWRFKPSPKPKVNIIKTKEEEDAAKQKELLQAANSNNGVIYAQTYNNDQGPHETGEEGRTESNELVQEFDGPEFAPETIRVTTVTPTEFTDFDNSRLIEIATIRSPYVFQAGNVKNTRYITLTKTVTKDMIQPTQVVAPSFGHPTLENILATRAPYEKILEGSNNIATLPVITLGSDTATPPLETVTQTFSTTQLMLKTSILPVLYEGVTTLYTLTQSYLVTRLVAAYKTVPPAELFQFVPTKSLTEFNTALQEAGTEHREHLLGSETNENENFENILAPPDELTSVGSDFDPSSMEDKFPKHLAGAKVQTKGVVSSPKPGGLPDLSNLTPEQVGFLRYFATAGQQGQGLLPMHPQLQNYYPSPLLPSPPAQFPVASSPLVVNTVTTIVETKTLRIQFGSKPTHTIIYSTRIVPTKVTTYVSPSVPSSPPGPIPNFFQPHHYPLAYVG